MKLAPECYACFLNQAVRTGRVVAAEKNRLFEIVRSVSRLLPTADATLPPPVVSREIYKLIHGILGTDDPYRELKKTCNETALKHITEARKIIDKNRDKLKASLMASLAGNIIDFGSQLTSFNIGETLRKATEEPLSIDDYSAFIQKLKKAKRFTLVCDNSGEIIFDRLLLETIKTEFPHLKISIIGRGHPIINDATATELVQLGFDAYGNVISSGQMIPALWPKECNDECKRVIEHSDIILAKGQGNFETLSELRDERIFFLFIVKCSVVAELLSLKKLSRVFLKNGRWLWEKLQG